MIHATALVADDARLGSAPTIGPYATVGIEGHGNPIRLGEGLVVRSHTVLYRGSVVGRRFHAGHGVLVREAGEIGDDVSVGSHSVVEHHVVLGDRVRLHSRCFLPEFTVVEDGAWLGPGVVVTNSRYPNRPDSKERLEGVRIGTGAVVGAGAVLLPGVTVGKASVIGAGAVVVRDVEEGVTVVGNPARPVRP